MSNPDRDYFADHYYEIAEQYFNSDASELSDIGQFVLNAPKLLRAFVEAWSNAGNTHVVQEWFEATRPENDEPEGDR